MLVLPIVNKNRILNVRISLKNAKKIRTRVNISGIDESDVVVNEQKFSSSIYNNNSINSILEFIRNSSILYKRNYTITTKFYPDKNVYDLYEVSYPPEAINDSLDTLYSYAILDMRKEIPGVNKGKYISFKDLGLDKYLTDEKISKLYKIVSEVKNMKLWPELFKKMEIFDLLETLNFVELFDCTVISEASISEKTFLEVLSCYEKINSRDTKGLRRYYNMALDNKEIYSKLSYINKLIYNKPFTLIQSKSQRRSMQFVKVNQLNGGEYNKAA